MAARWQQWMPFHIDKFMGSRYVQAMQPSARAGYLYLLAAQWQSDDCTLPKDEEELSVLSGLGCAWQESSRSIMRHFTQIESGRLQNPVLFNEWKEAKRVFEARQSGRKGKTHASVIDESSKKDDTQTLTGTVTKTEKHKKPSGKPEAEPSKHGLFHEQIDRYWKHKNGEEKAPWDGSEGKALSALLAAKPDLTIEQFRVCLKHRGDSPDELQGERPRQWLPNILRFLHGPVDRYGKPLQAKAPVPQLRGVTLEEAMQR